MQIYTSDKTSPRSFKELWYIRFVALVITMIVLGITAANTATFHSIGCDAPARLSYNLAVSILSLLALIYFILATGPNPATRLLPWFIWGQLVLDAIIYLFWLSAAATSGYSCIDLCNACDIADGYVYWGSLSCTCFSDIYYKRDYSPKPVNVLQPRSRTRRTTSVGSIAAKQAFDSLMTVLFALFIAADIYWIVKSRRASATTAPAPMNGPPMKNEEAGMPMGGVGAPAYAQQPNPENYSQTTSQGGYSGQPMMQNQGEPPQESYSGSPYTQGQTQHLPNQPQYANQTPYPQGQQVSSQPYPSPQGEHPPQYGGQVPQQASYPAPRDGVSEMHSPTEVTKANDPHHV